MDNKRVEQPLSLQEALEKAANEVMSCQWDDFEIYNPIQDVIKKAMEEYASQQCASLREENLLKQMSINDQHRSLVAKNEQIEELKKEVERLKADNLNHFKALKEWHEKLQRLQSDNDRLREELERMKEELKESNDVRLYHVQHMEPLLKKISILESALDEIIHPIKYMKQRADAEESSLNGYAAILANDPSYLRSIANKALQSNT